MSENRKPKIKKVTYYNMQDKDFSRDCHLVEIYLDGKKAVEYDHHDSPLTLSRGFIDCLKAVYGEDLVIDEELKNDPNVDFEE